MINKSKPEPLDLKERFKIRNQIHSAGRELYDSVEDKDLKWLVGEIMALNEDWVINHKDTVGAEIILEQGFSDNQLRWIKNLDKKLRRIKSACEFYKLFYGFNGMKELIVRVETGEIKLSKQRKRELYDFYLKYLKIFDKEKYYDLVNLIDKYNDWLFKLAFKDIFEEDEGVD